MTKAIREELDDQRIWGRQTFREEVIKLAANRLVVSIRSEESQ